MAATHDAGMRELHAKIILAQVRMCVEMDYAQVRVALRDGADAAERDEMLAAEQERDFPGVKDLRGALFNHVERGIGRTERKLKIARVEHGSIFGKVAVLEHRVCLYAERLGAHRRRPEAGPGAEARRGVVGSSEQHDLRIFERTVASYELARLGFHVVYARNGSSSFRMSRT